MSLLLYETLMKRVMPEQVARQIVNEFRPLYSEPERQALEEIASHRGQFSSMPDEFDEPVAPNQTAQQLLARSGGRFRVDTASRDPVVLRSLAAKVASKLGRSPDLRDFRSGRLNRAGRKEHSIRLKGKPISRRAYNRLFRMVNRFEAKLDAYEVELSRYSARRVAKSGLTTFITLEDFSENVYAACFVTYLAARRNRRSLFTNQSQDRAFDTLAELLLDAFERHLSPVGWYVIAHLMPDVRVVEHLSDSDKLRLLALQTRVLNEAGELLRASWSERFDRVTMMVQRGDDSSTWNLAAGAWNAARVGWVNVLNVLGMADVLDYFYPGKAMRLMAADVVRWHSASGGNIEPNTLVWAELPLPWEVLTHATPCPRELVESVCRKHGLDPYKTGWVANVEGRREAVPFEPTPDLVHGVTVDDPVLAQVLRRAGYFSGKHGERVSDEGFTIQRDQDGFATGVSTEPDAAVPIVC